jgi:hypothetical protein
MHYERFLATTDGVVMSRICLLMYFYTEHLFERGSDVFNNYLAFLLNCTNSSLVPRSVSN